MCDFKLIGTYPWICKKENLSKTHSGKNPVPTPCLKQIRYNVYNGATLKSRYLSLTTRSNHLLLSMSTNLLSENNPNIKLLRLGCSQLTVTVSVSKQMIKKHLSYVFTLKLIDLHK